jgi:chromosome partitioning protein
MKTIVINSQKGGSGKTMLAKHLAVAAEQAGAGPVPIINTDPQGSLTAWHKKREAESPVRIEVPFDSLAKGLSVLKAKGGKVCIIDSASGRLDVAAELFKLADLVLFPVQPSEDDLTAAPVTVANPKAAKARFLFVLTPVKPNTLITAQAAAILSKHGQVATDLGGRPHGYKSPYASGQVVTEADPKSPAAREIASLWRDVIGMIP